MSKEIIKEAASIEEAQPLIAAELGVDADKITFEGYDAMLKATFPADMAAEKI